LKDRELESRVDKHFSDFRDALELFKALKG